MFLSLSLFRSLGSNGKKERKKADLRQNGLRVLAGKTKQNKKKKPEKIPKNLLNCSGARASKTSEDSQKKKLWNKHISNQIKIKL